MNSSSNKPLLELPEVQTWNLQGKVVFITGGASGIGAATARLAASDGATVVVCDVDQENGQKIADETGGRFVSLDVTSRQSWAHATTDLEQLDAQRSCKSWNVSRSTNWCTSNYDSQKLLFGTS